MKERGGMGITCLQGKKKVLGTMNACVWEEKLETGNSDGGGGGEMHRS